MTIVRTTYRTTHPITHRTSHRPTARALLGLFLFIFGAYSFLVSGPAWYHASLRYSPIAPRALRRLMQAFNETGRGLLIGVGLTALAQGTVATIAYLILRIPSAFVLGLLTAIGSLVPSVGSALVWVPVAAGLALTGRWVASLVLVAIGVLVIGMGASFGPQMDGCIQGGTAPAMRVYGEAQSQRDVNAVYRLAGFDRMPVEQQRSMELRRHVADGLVDRALLARAARELGLSTNEDEIMREFVQAGTVRISLGPDAPPGFPYGSGGIGGGRELRLDLRDNIGAALGFGTGGTHYPEMLLGLSFTLNRRSERPASAARPALATRSTE